MRFTILGLARGIRLCIGSARQSVRRLAAHGALRLIERSKAGHLVEVRSPQEIRAAHRGAFVVANSAASGAANLEQMDFLQSKTLRDSLHARERNLCFYCLRRTSARTQCLDHVVPRAQLSSNSYRNLVSCCQECNARKGDRSAKDFLRRLYREERLTSADFADRLRALKALAAGKLRPAHA